MTLIKPACRPSADEAGRGRPKFNFASSAGRQKSVVSSWILVLVAGLFMSLARPAEAKAAVLDAKNLAYVPFFGPIINLGNTLFDNAVANADEEQELPVSEPGRADKLVQAVITSYTSTVDQCDDDPFIAASGKRVYDGMIAANWLPFGTKIKIPSLFGDKVFTVDDRMNSRYGYGRMDIWMDTTRAEARKFGVQRVEIEVYYK